VESQKGDYPGEDGGGEKFGIEILTDSIRLRAIMTKLSCLSRKNRAQKGSFPKKETGRNLIMRERRRLLP